MPRFNEFNNLFKFSIVAPSLYCLLKNFKYLQISMTN